MAPINPMISSISAYISVLPEPLFENIEAIFPITSATDGARAPAQIAAIVPQINKILSLHVIY